MDGKIITARKHSTDPAQEHLREQKAIWNRSTTDLITKIIAFKRGINGRGDPHTGLPASNIRDPLPSQVGHYLNEIATEYNALVEGAERIIQEQEHYSQIRRKPQSVPDQANVIDDSKDQIKLATWWGSRWWASNFGIKGEDRPLIKNMLRSAVSMRKKLLDIENYLSSSDENSIPKALYVTSSFGIGPYKNILESFTALREIHGRNLADPAPPQKTEIEKPPLVLDAPDPSSSQEINPIQMMNYLVEIQRDLPNLQSVVNYYIGHTDTLDEKKAILKVLKNSVNKGSDLSVYIGKLKQGLPLSEIENKDAEKIVLGYRKLLEMISQLIGFDSLNFADYSKKIQNLPLQATAYNPLSRFVNKQWLKHKPDLLRSDVDLDMRKQITIEHIDEVLRSLVDFMDILEQDKGIDQIFKSLKEVSNLLSEVVEDIITLAEYHMSMFRNENRNKRRGVILQPIIEREINKLRKANVGIKEMSSKILIHRPDFVTVPT